MEEILTDTAFDSKLESRNDSTTDLFDCLVPVNTTEDDVNENHSLQTNENRVSVENNEIPPMPASIDQSDAISNLVEKPIDRATPEADEPASNQLPPSVPVQDSSVETKSNDGEDFVPTIVDIFGACSEPIERSSVNISSDDKATEPNSLQPSHISIEDVQGNFKDSNSNGHDKEKCEDSVIDNSPVIPIHTIDDDCQDTISPNRTDNNQKSEQDALFNPNVVIKQEPQDEEVDNDCMLIDADAVGTCFTSEIEIKEERTENEDSEVVCIETTSQIPQPIPIKIEANFETDKEISSPKPLAESTSTKIVSKSDSDSLDDQSKNIVAKSFTVVGYKCHLCDTAFQEHELLNEHMRLHRNNSLAERYRRTYGKSRKHSKYICRTCGKRLSTGQSLAQHTMIHNNEKPHICPICKKDFRHLSNFKMHVQKHKEEEEQRRRERDRQRSHARIVATSLTADRSVARSADFGRLVGPLFVKETLLSKTASSEPTRPMMVPKVERKAFDLKLSRPRDSAKENIIFYQKMNSNTLDESYTRARKFNDDIGDDVIPLKTFNNVDNIVMNATKFIVKVDNLDPNLLKKKIKTPDISIDKSALEAKPPDRKRRITLSPADSAKRAKLDQIENIIMDVSEDGADQCNQEPDYAYADDYDYDDDEHAASGVTGAVQNKQETLTDNELFALLNDDDSRPGDSNLVHGSLTPSPAKSNVIVLKRPQMSPGDGAVSAETKKQKGDAPQLSSFSQYMAEKSKEKIDSGRLSELTIGAGEKGADVDEDVDLDKCDIYDKAFHNVALRRLTLIRRKAAQNGGKVEDRYLQGPLFWRKAVLKAQNNQLQKEPQMSLNEAKLAYKRLNAFKFGKLDTRRTNDAAKLQQRAELKLQFVLDRVKSMTDVDKVNLAGPLYWKRTLKLAGVHNPKDLKRLNGADENASIDDVQFVKMARVPKENSTESGELNGDEVTTDDEVIDEAVILDSTEEKNVPPSVAVQASDFLENVAENRLTLSVAPINHTNMVDSMLNDDLLKPVKKADDVIATVSDAVTPTTVSEILKDTIEIAKQSNQTNASKAESILYDSLTKPKILPKTESLVEIGEKTRVSCPPPKPTVTMPIKPNPTSSTIKNRTIGGNTVSATSSSTIRAAGNSITQPAIRSVPESVTKPASKAIPVTTNVALDAEVTDSAIEGGNIILNVDSADFQLLADSKGENGEETNYVLVSDGKGGVQLIKENDLQLVEDEATNTQYVVNMQGENFANFNLMGNANGEQLAYAIQLDGENYTTLQFVPDGVPLEAGKERMIGEKTVTIDGTNYVIADPAADLNHIGKELSDFLHIDYGALLKPENQDHAA